MKLVVWLFEKRMKIVLNVVHDVHMSLCSAGTLLKFLHIFLAYMLRPPHISKSLLFFAFTFGSVLLLTNIVRGHVDVKDCKFSSIQKKKGWIDMDSEQASNYEQEYKLNVSSTDCDHHEIISWREEVTLLKIKRFYSPRKWYCPMILRRVGLILNSVHLCSVVIFIVQWLRLVFMICDAYCLIYQATRGKEAQFHA